MQTIVKLAKIFAFKNVRYNFSLLTFIMFAFFLVYGRVYLTDPINIQNGKVFPVKCKK